MGETVDLGLKGARAGLSAASLNGAVRGAAVAKAFGATVLVGFCAAWTILGPVRLLGSLHAAFFALFAGVAAWRLVLPFLSRPQPRLLRGPARLPRYTVIVPLKDEAPMAAQIVRGLDALRYPRDRLQVLVVLEADDHATHAALIALRLAPHIRVLTCPPHGPATKPRACNVALTQATGELVVVYDAEDEPDPDQLLEAAARFAASPSHRGCLQAPLRVREQADGLRRQFALEYAALFEVVLPALSALRLPFPLGGTSNHFRRETLDDLGGWDAFNVTEDADIGLRLSASGSTLGVLCSPTWEEAPDTLDAWMPQRTRWLKGYVQTWSTLMRRPWRGGVRQVAAVQATLGMAILSGLLHGPLLSLAIAALLLAAIEHHASVVLIADVGLLAFAWMSAVAVLAVGARRAGLRMRWRDALGVIPYWWMQSLAAGFALHQLVRDPFRWDKTPHRPRATPPLAVAVLDAPPADGIAKAA